MATEKVHFAKEKETLLATLYGRALDYRASDPVLGDRMADEAVRRIDYDFSKLKLRPVDPTSIASRARQFDAWTAEYLSAHPDATVLHLGCGLDTRVYRLNPPSSVRWYDVDYPDVIELRRKLYSERPGHQMIGTSVTTPGWLEELPTDRPVLVVAEGLLMYLSEGDVRALLARVTSHFPSGELAFDALSRLALRMRSANPALKATGALLGWGLDDPHELERWIPRLRLVTVLSAVEMPGFEKLPRGYRVLVRLMNPIPALRNLGRLLLYRF